jgi:hypothetical protein
VGRSARHTALLHLKSLSNLFKRDIDIDLPHALTAQRQSSAEE